MAFINFLKKRKVAESVLQKFIDEKIDDEVVSVMTDGELANYLPHEGDRISLRFWARSQTEQGTAEKDYKEHGNKITDEQREVSRTLYQQMKWTTDDKELSDADTRTEHLLEKIRIKTKMMPGNKSKIAEAKAQKSIDGKVQKLHGSCTATGGKKDDVAVTFGLSLYTKGKYKQVRCQNGGGISHCRLDKPVFKSDIIKEAVSAFFPDGEGFPGRSADFSFDLASDVSGSRPFFETETADTFMKRLRQKKLRCYLLAKSNVESSSDEELPDFEVPQPLTCKNKEVIRPTSTIERNSDHSATHQPSTLPANTNENTLMYQISKPSTSSLSEPSEELPFANAEVQVARYEEVQTAHQMQYTTDFAAADIPQEFVEEDLVVRDGEITFNPATYNLNLSADVDINTTPESIESAKHVAVIEVHRGMACKDLIAYFMQTSYSPSVTYEVKMLKEDGSPELAEDNGGVMRDALTEFWDTFYLQYTVGNNFKVPWIRHDMSENHWQSVAMVLVMGFKQEGIFPIKLAPPFMEYACLGATTNILQPFLQYVADMDRTVIEEALKDWESVDGDDLLDFLDRYEAKKMATKETLEEILREIGHKEMVQKPSFVAQKWRDALALLNMDANKLSCVYLELQPTAKKVLRILKFPEDMNIEQNTLSNHLKRLIREFSLEVLGLFLRFCTGSDMMVKSTITIRFIKSDASCTVRTPTSHTCGAVLELPDSYGRDPYVSLKSEFSTLLRNRFWQMDIV